MGLRFRVRVKVEVKNSLEAFRPHSSSDLDSLLSFISCVYSTGHLTRNRKAGPGWISYLRMVAFHTNFSITNPNFLLTCKSQPAFLIAHFLVRYPVL